MSGNVDSNEPGAAVERSLAEIQSLYATVPGGVIQQDPDIRLCRSGLPWRVLNGAVLAELAPSAVGQRVRSIGRWFADAHVPWRWVAGPASSPPDLAQRLVDAGMSCVSDNPGMIADLADVDLDQQAGPPGLEVTAVDDQAALDAWCDVQRAGMELDAVAAAAWSEAHRRLGYGTALPLRNYVAWLDGVAVGAAALFLSQGIAGIYNVAVPQQRRNRGIGRAATLAALRDAAALGYRRSTLGASPLGVPVYRRIGYREVCRIRVFVAGPQLAVSS